MAGRVLNQVAVVSVKEIVDGGCEMVCVLVQKSMTRIRIQMKLGIGVLELLPH